MRAMGFVGSKSAGRKAESAVGTVEDVEVARGAGRNEAKYADTKTPRWAARRRWSSGAGESG